MLDQQTLMWAAVAAGVLVLVTFFIPERTHDEGDPAEAGDEAHDAFAGGFPVPPMPAGGAVRGAAEPLSFTHAPGGRTTVTASAESKENHE